MTPEEHKALLEAIEANSASLIEWSTSMQSVLVVMATTVTVCTLFVIASYGSKLLGYFKRDRWRLHDA